MPANKNAVVRYKLLDNLLRDKHHYYSMADLTDKVNEELEFMGYKPVTRRALEKDINFLEESPFNAEICRFVYDGKSCIKYARRNFSIFHKDLTEEEEKLIYEVLNTVGQFEGLPNFEWLDDLQADNKMKRHDKVIVFSPNPRVKNNHLLASLFEIVSNKQVIDLHYRRFGETVADIYEFHPYIIKQYENRWYLVGWRPRGSAICTLPLDRIEGFKPKMSTKLIPYEGDITKYFDDVIGITVIEGNEVEDIYFWVSDKEIPYVETKPIHFSQEKVERGTGISEHFENEYPFTKDGGAYYHIRCKNNYELERELLSHFGELVVLSPEQLRNNLKERISNLKEKYFM